MGVGVCVPGDTWKGRGTSHFGGKEEEESAEMRGGSPKKKIEGRGGRKRASAIPPFEKVAIPKKADTGSPDPCGKRPGVERGTPAQLTLPLEAPRPEKPAGRVREQVTLFTASPISEVPALVFRLEIKIIARVMNLML